MRRKLSVKCDGLKAVVKLYSALSSRLWVGKTGISFVELEDVSLAQLIPSKTFLILQMAYVEIFMGPT